MRLPGAVSVPDGFFQPVFIERMTCDVAELLRDLAKLFLDVVD
jgi:hypothetical protein